MEETSACQIARLGGFDGPGAAASSRGLVRAACGRNGSALRDGIVNRHNYNGALLSIDAADLDKLAGRKLAQRLRALGARLGYGSLESGDKASSSQGRAHDVAALKAAQSDHLWKQNNAWRG